MAVASKEQNGIKKAPATSSTHNPRKRLQGSKGMIPENAKSDGNANREEKTFNARAADNRTPSDHKAASNSDNESKKGTHQKNLPVISPIALESS